MTETVEVTGHICEPPPIDTLLQMAQPRPSYPSTKIAVDRGYRPERVFRMTLQGRLHEDRRTPSCTSGLARIKATAIRTRPSCSVTTTAADCSALPPGVPVTG